ncbi:MAG: transketolase C-terminal domain-containing protein [Parcubacteria group bacterium]|jgi:transketolase
MRNTFIKKLIELTDKDTFFFVGDLGFSVIEGFQKKFPKQFMNAGIAEQNMTGMSAGLALEGSKVFTYSIGNFNTTRCLEQIRNDVCLHNLDVNIVSVGGGFIYGSLGYSHHAVQDIAMLGSLPNMTLLLPGDPHEVEFCMKYIFKNKGPKYLRIGKNGTPCFNKNPKTVKNINCFNENVKANIAIISVSTMLPTVVEINKILEKKGIRSNIFSCPIIDKDFAADARKRFKKFDFIFTVEEHLSAFGFGSIISNIFEGKKNTTKSFGAERDLCKLTGNQGYLCESHGLGANNIASEIKKFIKINN